MFFFLRANTAVPGTLASVTPGYFVQTVTTSTTATGNGTHWTTSAPTVTVQNVSGVTSGVTISGLVVNSDTSITFNVSSTGTDTGNFTLTITNGTDGALVSSTLQVGAALVSAFSSRLWIGIGIGI